MFRWYHGSAICYAYLEDVDRDVMLHDPDHSFQNCRWITRGWCLQELIAPAFVTFYDKNWREIGTKQEFADQLSRATSVDIDVLRDSSRLSTVLVAKRLSWAANRKTTRVEDMAYCLMGIFDVNMPMLYGEGSKAFFRLQQEIFGATHDVSIFAWWPDDSCGKKYLPMFAPSLRHFASCANVERCEAMHPYVGVPILGQAQFTVTQQHILTRHLDLVVYSWPSVLCYCFSTCTISKTTSHTTNAVFLQKVGPSLFVRTRRPQLAENHPDSFNNCLEEAADIYLRPGPALYGMFDTSHAWGVRVLVREPNRAGQRLIIGGIEPVERYDLSRDMFLVQGLPHLSAYINMMVGFGGEDYDQFTMVCEVWPATEDNPNSTSGFDPTVTVNAGMKAKVMLIDKDDWQKTERLRQVNWRVAYAFELGRKHVRRAKDQAGQILRLTRCSVSMVVSQQVLEGSPIFGVSLDWRPEPTSGGSVLLLSLLFFENLILIEETKSVIQGQETGNPKWLKFHSHACERRLQFPELVMQMQLLSPCMVLIARGATTHSSKRRCLSTPLSCRFHQANGEAGWSLMPWREASLCKCLVSSWCGVESSTRDCRKGDNLNTKNYSIDAAQLALKLFWIQLIP